MSLRSFPTFALRILLRITCTVICNISHAIFFKMAAVSGALDRNKKGFFVSPKEKERRENLKKMLKRKFSEVESEEENERVSSDRESAFELTGRRVVELDVLAKSLDSGCKTCRNPLKLSNCQQETLAGLGSFLYINCSNSECGEINVCVTNKTHRPEGVQRGRPIFDVNTKLAAGGFRCSFLKCKVLVILLKIFCDYNYLTIMFPFN